MTGGAKILERFMHAMAARAVERRIVALMRIPCKFCRRGPKGHFVVTAMARNAFVRVAIAVLNAECRMTAQAVHACCTVR